MLSLTRLPLQRCLSRYEAQFARMHFSISTLALRKFEPRYCPAIPTTSTAHFSTSDARFEEDKKNWPFRMTMSEEQKKRKEEKIEEMKKEEEPKTILAKVKYYFKRYWYIAVPAHMIGSTIWFGSMFAIVHSGVDVIRFLQMLHIPDALVEKVQNTPPAAGAIVIALLLYKAAFWTLRRMGKLRTVREVEYKVRTEYEMNKQLHGRRLYKYRNLGVRGVAKKNAVHANSSSVAQSILHKKDASNPPDKPHVKQD